MKDEMLENKQTLMTIYKSVPAQFGNEFLEMATKEIIRRRNIAHEKDMEEEDKYYKVHWSKTTIAEEAKHFDNNKVPSSVIIPKTITKETHHYEEKNALPESDRPDKVHGSL